MEELWVFLVVFGTLICSLCTATLVPLRQYSLRIDARYFRRVKVKFFAFLFAGIGGRRSEQGDVKNFGVIVPMFVLHVLGYVLTLFIWAIVPTLYYRFGIDLDVLVLIPFAVAMPFGIAVVVTEFICVSLSSKRQIRENQSEKQAAEESAEKDKSEDE